MARKRNVNIIEKIPGEIWLDVIGYEGMYQVSNIGRVKSLDRKMNSGIQKNVIRSGGLLKPVLNRHGYVTVALSKNNFCRWCKVHRLLAMAFIPNPKTKRCVNHKDGRKDNNTISNLEWSTDSENQKHAFRTGLKHAKRGDSNGNAKFSQDQIDQLKTFSAKTKMPYSEYGKMFGMSTTYVHAVLSGRIRGKRLV